MGFSEHDLPNFDVVERGVLRSDANVEERPLTPAEQANEDKSIEIIRGAVAVWDTAWDEVPELAPANDGELTAAQ